MTATISILVLLCLILFFCLFIFGISIFSLVISMRIASFVPTMADRIDQRFKNIFQAIEEAEEAEEEEQSAKPPSGLIDINQVNTYDPRFSPK